MTTTPENIRGIRAALAMLAAQGSPDVLRLIAGRGAQDAYARLAQAPALTQGLHMLLGPDPSERLSYYTRRANADTERAGARIVIPEDSEWPPGLPDLAGSDPESAPTAAAAAICLWVRGNLGLDTVLADSVAVTGARAATAYGIDTARDIGFALSAAGHTVISTSAYGIDTAALTGALASGAVAVAVMAAGVHQPYPAGNTRLLQQLAETGLIVSAYPPHVTPSRTRFAATAKLLAALTRGTVVVEAGLRSLSLTTLEQASALDRPAMAVPGPVTSALSEGVHQAMRDNPRIRLVRRAADVINELAGTTR